MSKAFTDEQMISAIRDGGKSLEEVMSYIYYDSPYRESIRRYILQQNGSREDAEDIFQDGVCQMILNVQRGKFRGKSSLRTYLTTICKNIWFTKFTRKAKHAEIVQSIQPNEKTAHSPDQILFQKQRSQSLEDILSRLGEKCKTILGLWALHYSMKEIMRETGYKSEGMARKKKHQCMQRLTSMLKDQPALIKELTGSL